MKCTIVLLLVGECVLCGGLRSWDSPREDLREDPPYSKDSRSSLVRIVHSQEGERVDLEGAPLPGATGVFSFYVSGVLGHEWGGL